MYKMKKIYRLNRLVLALIIIILSSACGNRTSIRDGNTYIEPNQKHNIDIKMLVIGKEPEDFSLVLHQVNDILQEEINVKLMVEFIGIDDLDIEYHSIFAGSSDFDLIQILPYHYNEYANKRAYMLLTDDMLQKCIPKTLEQEGQQAISQVRIDEILYMIPSYAFMEREQVAIIRGDLPTDDRRIRIETLEDIEKYLYRIRYNTDITPLLTGKNGSKLLDFFYLQQGGVERYDQFYFAYDHIKNRMVWMPEESYFTEFCLKIHSWKNSGLIPDNASSKKIIEAEAFYTGETAMYIGDIYEVESLYRKIIIEKPEYKPQLIHLGGEINQHRQPTHHGIALKNGTTNAAKSLQVIELINTNEKVFRLLNYGVLGKHYDIKDEKYYEPLSESSGYPIYNTFVWCMNDTYRLDYNFITPGLERKSGQESMQRFKATDMSGLDINALNELFRYQFEPMTLGQISSVSQIQEVADALGFQKYYEEVKSCIEY